jgi:hypothetical protein
MASRSATDAAFTLVTRVAVPRSLKMIYSLDRPRASASFAHTPLLPDLAAGTCRQAPLRRALKNGRGRGVQAALPFDSFLTRRGSPSVRPYGFAWRTGAAGHASKCGYAGLKSKPASGGTAA